MATYVVGDIHNSLIKLNGVLKQISLSYKDNLILLGDLFDRGAAEPDPVGVYSRICGLDARVTWIRGNHDQLLADYIYQYYGLPEKKKGSLRSYRYNSFDLMNKRLTEADMLNIADQIMKLPLQAEMEIDGVKYLFAHAMTHNPQAGVTEADAYLEGTGSEQEYLVKEVDGYVSFVGHHDSSYQKGNLQGHYLDKEPSSVWQNEVGNLYMMDCGCGLPGGRLACICLETGERFYS